MTNPRIPYIKCFMHYIGKSDSIVFINIVIHPKGQSPPLKFGWIILFQPVKVFVTDRGSEIRLFNVITDSQSVTNKSIRNITGF